MMSKSTQSYAELLGVTPISSLTDEQIWEVAVSPMVKATLGELGEAEISLRDTTDGDFPGDEVSNQNQHVLFGSEKRVRFPYLYSRYRTKYGLFIVKRDFVKIEAIGWIGRPERGNLEMVFKFGLRDRRLDGTVQANDSALVDFPYDNPERHGVLQIDGKPAGLTSVETSLYSFYPGTTLGSALGEPEFEKFVGKPLSFVDNPDKFVEYFERVWNMSRFPGQIGTTFIDVGSYGQKAFDKLSSAAGYDIIETCPSYLHVVRWNMRNGYTFVRSDQEETFNAIEDAIRKLKEGGEVFTAQQESWLTFLQNVDPSKLSDKWARLHFGIPWPHQPVAPDYKYLWLIKPLSGKAHELLGIKRIAGL